MLKHYLTLAVKVLLRRKFFTFISLFGISFTLLVLMVVTAIMDHALGPGAPETKLDRTLYVNRVTMYGPHSTWSSAGGFKLYDTYARDLPGVERLSLYTGDGAVQSYVGGRKIVSSLKLTDGDYWRIFDFTFLEGGPFTSDDLKEARMVAVVNRTTRQRFFDGKPALGHTIEADGQRYRIIGVVEDVSELRNAPYADIWAPYTTSKTDAYKREIMGGFNAIALARTKADMEQIHDEFNSRLLRAELPDPKNYKAIVAPFETKLEMLARMMPTGDRKDPNRQTWKFVGFVATLAFVFLLIPTVNLVNINISRIMERASEIGVRKAFGAPSRTLVVQFLVENILLTVVGGILGYLLSIFVLRTLSATNIASYAHFTVNVRVFFYGMGLALIFGVLSGVYPAWRMSRLNPVEALKGGVSR